MSITVRTRAALGAAALLLSVTVGQHVASAQLTPQGVPVISFSPGPTTISQPVGGEFALSVVGDVYTLSGDAHARLPADPVPPSFSVYVFATQRVTVGPLPVQITPTATASYKLVNGGGPASATFPSTTVHTAASIIEFDDTPGSERTIPVLQSESADHTLAGNGFSIISDDAHPAIPSYVLGAGLIYDLSLFYQMNVDLTGGPEVYPTIVVTLEAGGISEWPGLAVDWNAVTVPEPASAAVLLALATPALLARRARRAGR